MSGCSACKPILIVSMGYEAAYINMEDTLSSLSVPYRKLLSLLSNTVVSATFGWSVSYYSSSQLSTRNERND